MSDRYLVWDGVRYPIPTSDPAPPHPPDPVTPPPGDVTATTAVVVGRAQHDVNGVNVPRGVDDLIVYARPATATGTNRWGVEVTVLAGIVTSVRDREASGVGQDVATPVPAGGFVLSGHRASRVWLLANATVGAPVALVAGDPVAPPVPVPPSGTVPDRSGNIAVWVMMWPDSPRFDWTSIQDEVTEVRLAFLINGGQPVGDGPWGLDGLRSGIAGFLKDRPDRFVSFAMGGGGYEVSIPSVAGYVAAAKDAEKRWLPGGALFGGGNVDWESARFRDSGDLVAAVLRQFKAERPGFFCSWSPNSSFRDDYITVATRNLDVVDALGYQCYDIPGLTYTGGVHPNVQEVYRDKFLAAGIPANKLEIAMMIEPGRNDRWSIDQCTAAAQQIKADFGVTRTAFWQAGRPEFPAWARAMRRVNPAPAAP